MRAVFECSAADIFQVCTQFNAFQRNIGVLIRSSGENAVANANYLIRLLAGDCHIRNRNVSLFLACVRQTNDLYGIFIDPAIYESVILRQFTTGQRNQITSLSERAVCSLILGIKSRRIVIQTRKACRTDRCQLAALFKRYLDAAANCAPVFILRIRS